MKKCCLLVSARVGQLILLQPAAFSIMTAHDGHALKTDALASATGAAGVTDSAVSCRLCQCDKRRWGQVSPGRRKIFLSAKAWERAVARAVGIRRQVGFGGTVAPVIADRAK